MSPPNIGLIRFLGPGPDAWRPLAFVISDCQRGTSTLQLDSTDGLHAGMWISLSQDASADDLSLEYDLVNRDKCPYGTCIAAGPGGKQLRWHSRVAEVCAWGMHLSGQDVFGTCNAANPDRKQLLWHSRIEEGTCREIIAA